MNEQIYSLFSLSPPFTIQDVKKAYRTLAHQHHPDHFLHTGAKKQQALLMADITEVYQQLLKKFKDNTPSSANPSPTDNDNALHRQALVYYQEYFDTFFKMFSERSLKEVEEKEQCLQNARNLFSRILLQYPDSDWTYDAEEKISNIDRAIESLYK